VNFNTKDADEVTIARASSGDRTAPRDERDHAGERRGERR